MPGNKIATNHDPNQVGPQLPLESVLFDIANSITLNHLEIWPERLKVPRTKNLNKTIKGEPN